MKWKLKEHADPEAVERLSMQLQVDKFIAQLLVQRGITTFEEAKSFFRPNLDELHSPWLMHDMEDAIERLQKALNNQEKILIYGDYDVDGTSSVALVFSYLKSFYEYLETYIPDRYSEGYGISFQGIDYASENEFSLIIALDCGIKAIDKVAYAQTKGVDFIICDHHQPGEEVPQAVAILNPKQACCAYPYKELCGCGVGFKLIQALHQRRQRPFEELLNYLDLVTIAIAADIVPITGENRILAYYGLQTINQMPRVGIQALLGEKKQGKTLTISDIVFGIAPKINAAGRIKHGNYAVALLIENDREWAQIQFEEIDAWNTHRKSLDQTITQEALLQIEENKEQDAAATVVFAEHWHKGVIGIVASRLTETYYRPTLVFTKSGDFLAASARSVKGFDVYQALEKCATFIEQFGGHKYAAGLTILPENYELFKNAFEDVVRRSLPEECKEETLEIDALICLNDLTDKNLRILKQFEPHGPENMTPCFASKHIFDTGYAKTIGKDKNHLSLFVKQPDATRGFAAVGFDLGQDVECFDNMQKHWIAYTLNENHFNGKVHWQLMLRDFKPE